MQVPASGKVTDCAFAHEHSKPAKTKKKLQEGKKRAPEPARVGWGVTRDWEALTDG